MSETLNKAEEAGKEIENRIFVRSVINPHAAAARPPMHQVTPRPATTLGSGVSTQRAEAELLR
jgi:hypothetical protein